MKFSDSMGNIIGFFDKDDNQRINLIGCVDCIKIRQLVANKYPSCYFCFKNRGNNVVRIPVITVIKKGKKINGDYVYKV